MIDGAGWRMGRAVRFFLGTCSFGNNDIRRAATSSGITFSFLYIFSSGVDSVSNTS
jgi:hypothetical protein